MSDNPPPVSVDAMRQDAEDAREFIAGKYTGDGVGLIEVLAGHVEALLAENESLRRSNNGVLSDLLRVDDAYRCLRENAEMVGFIFNSYDVDLAQQEALDSLAAELKRLP